MTVRAAAMAQIIMEQWRPENETAETFAMRHFATDKLSDLERAIEIVGELERAALPDDPD